MLDRLVADHAAIAHQHALIDIELRAQPLHLGQQRGTVGHVAGVHGDRYRAAARIGQQPMVDLQQPLAAITAIEINPSSHARSNTAR